MFWPRNSAREKTIRSGAWRGAGHAMAAILTEFHFDFVTAHPHEYKNGHVVFENCDGVNLEESRMRIPYEEAYFELCQAFCFVAGPSAELGPKFGQVSGQRATERHVLKSLRRARRSQDFQIAEDILGHVEEYDQDQVRQEADRLYQLACYVINGPIVSPAVLGLAIAMQMERRVDFDEAGDLIQEVVGESLGPLISTVPKQILSWRLTEVEFVSFEQFLQRTLGGRPVQMDLSPYRTLDFDCVCGKRHELERQHVVRELSQMRLVVQCPMDVGLTCIKVRGILRVHLESLFGAYLETGQT